MARKATPDPDDELQRIGALIDAIGIGMLATRAADGAWVSRPVAPLPGEDGFNGTLWVFTSKASHKASEIRAHPWVNLAMASPRDNAFVSLSGQARVRRDSRRIAALWTPAQRIWFPGGPDDPDLTLLRLDVETAEYWDGPTSWAGKALRFAVAAATRNPDATGSNRTVRIERQPRGDHATARVVRGNTRGDAARAEAEGARRRARK